MLLSLSVMLVVAMHKRMTSLCQQVGILQLSQFFFDITNYTCIIVNNDMAHPKSD